MSNQKLWKFITCLFVNLQSVSYVLSRGDGGQQGPWQQGPPQDGWNSGGSHTKGGDAPLGGWDDEVSNPWGGYPEDTSRWKLEDSIPGMPGKSYPNLDKIPETSFDCRRQKSPGYYGDVESQCQVFHICQAGGRQNSFLCPVGTIFNQETFVCDWWFNVNCGETASHYDRNSNLHRGSDIGIDGVKIMRAPPQGNNKGSDQSPPVGIPAWDQGNEGSWGMKGHMNQNRPQDSWSGPPNMNPDMRRQMGGGRNRQDKGTPGLTGTGMRPGAGMNAWPARASDGEGNQGGQQKGQAMRTNQKGPSGRGQQRNNAQRTRQKGVTQPQNQNWRSNQKGEGGNRNIQKRMGGNQNLKGDTRRQRKPEMGNRNIKAGQMGPRNVANQNRRMKGLSGRGGGMDKGSNINNWSMGLQNIQNRVQEAGNTWNGNKNVNLPQINNANPPFQMNTQWQNHGDNFEAKNQNNLHFKEENMNDNWNNNQWNSNVINADRQPQHSSFDNVNNFGMPNNFNYDYNYSENSWSHKKKEISNYQSSDYDYNS